MLFSVKRVFLLIYSISHLYTTEGKVFKRCELARELYEKHEIPMDQLATWVCIAFHESRYDTAARNRGSGDHGIFQISEHFWCSAKEDDILACGVPCSALEDDDIEDDVTCARRVYRQHQRVSGNGFNGWAVYGYYCKDPEKVQQYTRGCFDRNPKLPLFFTIKLHKTIEESSKEKTTSAPPKESQHHHHYHHYEHHHYLHNPLMTSQTSSNFTSTPSSIVSSSLNNIVTHVHGSERNENMVVQNQHHHSFTTTKKPFHIIPPRSEKLAKQFSDFGKLFGNKQKSRDISNGVRKKENLSDQTQAVYSLVKEGDHEFSLNSNGFILKFEKKS